MVKEIQLNTWPVFTSNKNYRTFNFNSRHDKRKIEAKEVDYLQLLFVGKKTF